MINLDPVLYQKLSKKYKTNRFIIILLSICMLCVLLYCYYLGFVKNNVALYVYIGLILFLCYYFLFRILHQQCYYDILENVKQIETKSLCIKTEKQAEFLAELKRFFSPFVYERKIKLSFSGDLNKKDFSLYLAYLPFPATRYFSLQYQYWFKIAPINNFKNTVIIARKYRLISNGVKNISNILIDTQNTFDIYSDDENVAKNLISKELIDALISYSKTTDKDFMFFITPQGILFAKEILGEYNFGFFLQKNFDKAVNEILKEYEDAKAGIDLINLLEKK